MGIDQVYGTSVVSHMIDIFNDFLHRIIPFTLYCLFIKD
jgi:hypothetical protein